MARFAFLLGAELHIFLKILASSGQVTGAGASDGAHPIRGFLRVGRHMRNGQFGSLLPTVQFQGIARGQPSLMLGDGPALGPRNVVQICQHLAGFGLLAALKIGVIQKVERVELVMRLAAVLLRGVRRGCRGRDVGRY